jgi:prevent-host-death family protein
MRTLSIKEARMSFSRLVDLAERGETVVITRNGKGAARLCSMPRGAKPLPPLAEFRAAIVRPPKGLAEAVMAARRAGRF